MKSISAKERRQNLWARKFQIWLLQEIMPGKQLMELFQTSKQIYKAVTDRSWH